MTENEEIIAASYGKSDSIDISTESLEFDIAAVLGRVVSKESDIQFHFCGVDSRLFVAGSTHDWRSLDSDC